MTVKQLKKILEQIPNDKEVFLDTISDSSGNEIYVNNDYICITDEAETSIQFNEIKEKTQIFLEDGSSYFYKGE